MSLNSIVDPGNSSLRSQGWLKVEAMRLTWNDINIWNDYIWNLKKRNIQIGDIFDRFIWMFSSKGEYTPREGYNFFI